MIARMEEVKDKNDEERDEISWLLTAQEFVWQIFDDFTIDKVELRWPFSASCDTVTLMRGKTRRISTGMSSVDRRLQHFGDILIEFQSHVWLHHKRALHCRTLILHEWVSGDKEFFNSLCILCIAFNHQSHRSTQNAKFNPLNTCIYDSSAAERICST